MHDTTRFPQQLIDAARELYLKYQGRRFSRIERELRERGWTQFYRELLYTRPHRYGAKIGWPELYGWDREVGRPSKHKKVAAHAFENWLTSNFSELTWNWPYQRYIYRRLARLASGDIRRLMIFMPPRHGKSEMVTVRYTAWRLLNQPALNVILGSYNQKLADKFSRKIKRIVDSGQLEVDSPRDQSSGSPPCLGGVAEGRGGSSAKDDVNSPLSTINSQPRRVSTASEWETPTGGTVRSVGVGAGIAGFGAGLIVIDDPVRNRAEAESLTYRDRVWEWFNDDIYTRMEPDASIILIQTRWHEDDLAGRLLKEMHDGGEKWEVISLPALSEPPASAGGQFANKSSARSAAKNSPLSTINSPLGTADPLGRLPNRALCPARFNYRTLLRYKRKLGTYSFSALYQQQPVPLEGGRFKREWFRNIVDREPPGLTWARGYDLAISTRTSADYTASFRCARDRAGNLYVADGFRARIEYPDQRRYIIERMRAERSTEHGIEAAMHGRALVQDLRREFGPGRFAFRAVQVDTDKLTRALAWLNLAEEGRLILVRGPWIDAFIDEVTRFPSARHDDQIDAVSIAVNMLDQPQPSKRAWGF